MKPDTNCDRIDGYALVRISGTSYILSCTRMCRQLGVVDGEYVKVTLERTGKAADGEDREISPCVRACERACEGGCGDGSDRP